MKPLKTFLTSLRSKWYGYVRIVAQNCAQYVLNILCWLREVAWFPHHDNSRDKHHFQKRLERSVADDKLAVQKHKTVLIVLRLSRLLNINKLCSSRCVLLSQNLRPK